MDTLKTYLGEWMKVLDRQELLKIMSFLDTEYLRKNITPLKGDVFNAFIECPYSELKVVMISQDPYSQPGVATGILFGNRSDTLEKDLSPSLKLVKETVIDFEVPHNLLTFDNSLKSWANQGILMINAALTVEVNKVGSHMMLWRPLLTSMLTRLSEINSGIIYVLFGSAAHTFEPYINGKSNYILKYKHPAYYARTGKRFECDGFKKVNEILLANMNTKIKWYEEG